MASIDEERPSPTIDDLASECVDRTENPRGWVIARNWIERALAHEKTLRELRAISVTLPPKAREILDRSRP